MRLISQTGDIDIPYETTSLSRTENIIRAYVSMDGEIGMLMAVYSTEEQAKEAMSMLMYAHISNKPIFILPKEGKTKLESTFLGRYELKLLRENLPNVMDLKNENGDYVLPRKIRDSIKEIAAALNVSGL
ncbi:hypothetical protein DMI82_12405 [Blautia sp. BCRC 81119]|uniref:hypothetical protein n=1 Tax=Blautia sp. BCRC 81119 TaxID=2212480 RepID=UPI000D72A7BC|nr:hypothetical protein [Blautia sp. BCRC 81119]PWY59016.1 hypothetical protein DMI82_12405 [Blautia sp. BCRC 81119]